LTDKEGNKSKKDKGKVITFVAYCYDKNVFLCWEIGRFKRSSDLKRHNLLNIVEDLDLKKTTRWRSWLRCCATNRNVAGLIPDGVTGIFH
jgi:hypothetical protein